MVPHVDSLQWRLWLNKSGLSACWLLLPCYVVAVKRFEGTFNINSEVFLNKQIQGLKDVIIVYSLQSFPWIQNPEHVYNQSLECLTGRNMFKKRHHCAVAVAASALLAARPFLPRLFQILKNKYCIPFKQASACQPPTREICCIGPGIVDSWEKELYIILDIMYIYMYIYIYI